MLQIRVESLLYEFAHYFLVVFGFEDEAMACASDLYYLRVERSIVGEEILHFVHEGVCLCGESVGRVRGMCVG